MANRRNDKRNDATDNLRSNYYNVSAAVTEVEAKYSSRITVRIE